MSKEILNKTLIGKTVSKSSYPEYAEVRVSDKTLKWYYDNNKKVDIEIRITEHEEKRTVQKNIIE